LYLELLNTSLSGCKSRDNASSRLRWCPRNQPLLPAAAATAAATTTTNTAAKQQMLVDAVQAAFAKIIAACLLAEEPIEGQLAADNVGKDNPDTMAYLIILSIFKLDDPTRWQ